jgi:DNA-binding NtrC family response regulator
MPAGDDSQRETSKLSTASAERLRASRTGPPRVSLLVYHREGGRLVPLLPDVPVVVGRAPPADVTIADVSLSREHARFTLAGEEIIVEDLASTNGTFVGRAPVERASLTRGDEVTMGTVTVTVHHLGGGALGTDIAGHDRFRELLETEVDRARFFRRPLAVILARSTRTRPSPVRSWAPRVQAALRPVDRAGLYSENAMVILMPEASSDQALEHAQALMTSLADEVSLVCGVAAFPSAGMSAEELLDECRAAAQRATPASPVQRAAHEEPTVELLAANDQQAFIARSEAMRSVADTAARVARSMIPVLLLGETGTGKEVISRFIHEAGQRRDRPMVCVNCAAIPAQLLESTLFGHEKGAFTGAHVQHRGVFEAARGGTVFLDEIGELPAAAQAALLRVLETKRFMRVGSTKEIAVDARVIAATHRDLEVMVAEGTFRQDLFYRLNTITLKVPPLRERSTDIPALAARFLQLANEANDTRVQAIDADAMELLASYGWPGNVRELKNALERAVVIAQGDTVSVDDLPERVRGAAKLQRAASSPASEHTDIGVVVRQLDGDFRARMERLEAEVLRSALLESGWNQTEAARRLSMPIRTLYYKVKMHRIRKPDVPK